MTQVAASSTSNLPFIVEEVLGRMRDELDGAASEFEPSVARVLRGAVTDMTTALGIAVSGYEQCRTTTKLLARADVALRTMLDLAKARVRDVPFNLVHKSTLRLYTDASLLGSVLDLVWGPERAGGGTDAAGNDSESDSKAAVPFWRESVRRLDMAIIVAGAVGPGRMDAAQALIRAIQVHMPLLPTPSQLATSTDSRSSPRPAKRHRLASPSSSTDTAALRFAPTAIPERDPPTPTAYISDPDLTFRPFIMRGFLNKDTHLPRWRALERWKDPAHLLRVTGQGRVVPVEVGTSYDEEDWGQRILPFEVFLKAAGWNVELPPEYSGVVGEDRDDDLNGAPLYLAQHSLFTQFPGLEKDTVLPDYVWSEPPSPPDMPSYKAPPDVLTNVWIGPGSGVVSPAHTDPYFNCYAQVLGSKRVWLAPPSAGPHMYPHSKAEGSPSTPDKPDSGDNTAPAASTLAGQYMSNTSTVAILRDVPMDTDQKRFPAFMEHVYPDALEAVLNPGDMLVMPPGWWHAMRGESEETCWSVSFWY